MRLVAAGLRDDVSRARSRDLDARATSLRLSTPTFPNVSAVHILLDYFIDQAEDREHRELNFVACYSRRVRRVERVRGLVGQRSPRVRTIAHAEGHAFLLNAMCLFYLTHPKVFAQRFDSESAAFLGALG